jgi:hypothetical protein
MPPSRWSSPDIHALRTAIYAGRRSSGARPAAACRSFDRVGGAADAGCGLPCPCTLFFDYARSVSLIDEAGKTNWNSAPVSPSDDAVSWPWCCSTIRRQIASPKPMPCDFVVKKAPKISFNFCGSIPVPESSTTTAMASLPRRSVATRSTRARSVTVSIASSEFWTRLRMTSRS